MGVEGKKLEFKIELSPKRRRQLQSRLDDVLQPELSILSTELQQILCDDLVTALENRLIVIAQATAKFH
jgi:hypothetical protein